MSTKAKKMNTLCSMLSFFIITLFFVGISTLNAAEEGPKYVPLVGLPGLDEKGATSLPDYINNVYVMLIVIGSLLGVLRIAWAGVKYSLSDVVTEKSAAKSDITGVLMGLAILLLPFIVLREINPDLVKLDVFSEARNHKIELPGKGSTGTKSTQPESQAQNLPEGTVMQNCSFDPHTSRFGIETGLWDGSKCRTQCTENGGVIVREVTNNQPRLGSADTPDYLVCGTPPKTEDTKNSDTTTDGSLCRLGESKEQCQAHCSGTVEEQTNIGGAGLVCRPRPKQTVQTMCTDPSDTAKCNRECSALNGKIISSTPTQVICEHE